MAAESEMMVGVCPAKRPRLDSSLDSEDEWQSISNKKISPVSESMSGSNGESTMTSDSGFNDFAPQSIEESSAKMTSNSSYYKESDVLDQQLDESPSSNEPSSALQNGGDEDDRHSVSSTASDFSGISNLSNMSGKDWKPCAGPMSWVQQQMMKGVSPRSVLTHLLGNSWNVPGGVSDMALWQLILNMLSEPPRRERLRHIKTIEDVVRLIRVCKNIVVLTGAGVSVSCGIPDFRSKDGIYSRLAVDFPDLPDPQAMFDIQYFQRDPRPFFKFAKEIYPGQFSPSKSHKFIRLIEQRNKLLRNYTQNIDTLEQTAGIERVIQCHGSFANATCQKCARKVHSDVIKEDILSQRIPVCSVCDPEGITLSKIEDISKNASRSHCSRLGRVSPEETDPSPHSPAGNDTVPDGERCDSSTECSKESDPIIKPDIVFFGEGLPAEFHDRMADDKDKCDLLIVIGSSLKVRPVALIPSSIPANVPQILINRESLNHLTFDVELLGDCDVIVSELCRRLGDGWAELGSGEQMKQILELPPKPDSDTSNGVPQPETIPHPKDESDIEALRACWAPKVKESMAERLPKDSFLHLSGGHRYVFPGAEVYYDPDDAESDDSSSESEVDPSESPEDTNVPVDQSLDSLLLSASCSDPNENKWGTSESQKTMESSLGETSVASKPGSSVDTLDNSIPAEPCPTFEVSPSTCKTNSCPA